MTDYTEYVFIKKDGSKRYEIVTERKDVLAFLRMHKAVTAMPLAHYEKQQEQSA